MGRRRRGRNPGRRKGRLLWALCIPAGIVAAGTGIYILFNVIKEAGETPPEELLLTYMAHIQEREYEEMYKMLDAEASGVADQEAYIRRNSAIYEGIEVKDLKVEILEYDKKREAVRYETSMDTAAGEISFENEALFRKGEKGYGLIWEDGLIFPGLGPEDRVKVATLRAERGEILDRNGRVLAGVGTASSVGIVPGKMGDRESAIQEIGELLGLEPEVIGKKLSAGWVKEDSFVPVKTIPKIPDIEYVIPLEPDEAMEQEKERQERLLRIPGVMISDIEVRSYPFGAAASHLTGYVQNVTAEDLEKHPGEGYTAASVIGRNGMEALFEKELKGQNGCRIYIVNSEGKEKEELAYRPVQHGEDIRLTIDVNLQNALYEQFKEDKSCSAALDPYTGEVLALVSTPSYDSNDFIMGLSGEAWTALNEDEGKPLYNRFRQVWCPGSTFKPVTAAIGLDSGAVGWTEDYGNEGLSWQKDASWGGYYVTTLHAYEPVTMENALIYSDNIYFAKAALKIGAERMKSELEKLGFQEEIPFEIVMQKSRYSNTEEISSEIQLADSGYGQGQILVNPLHMACLYTAFCNEGNVLKPRLVWQENAEAEYWLPSAFSEETADRVLGALKKVVNDPAGTGYAAHMEDVLLAGKTGTAEIKESKEDTTGTELGWFAVFTAERTQDRPILIISMTEDVKGRGGSGYVTERDRRVLEQWFSGN